MPTIWEVRLDRGLSMRKQYLHLSVCLCDHCHGPVVAGSLATRENEISRETEISQIGALCLSCGQRQTKVAELGSTRQFPPIEWHSEDVMFARGPAAVAEKIT